MCKKVRNYQSERIDVCRNCQGVGLAQTEGDPQPSKCPVCGGSGRIKKTAKIEITIEPYTGSDVVK